MDDHSPSLEDGLAKELLKRLGEGVSSFRVEHTDYRSSLKDAKSNVVAHFYVKCLTLEQLQDVEAKAPLAKDYGLEVGPAWNLLPHLSSLWSLSKERPLGKSWFLDLVPLQVSRTSSKPEHLQAG